MDKRTKNIQQLLQQLTKLIRDIQQENEHYKCIIDTLVFNTRDHEENCKCTSCHTIKLFQLKDFQSNKQSYMFYDSHQGLEGCPVPLDENICLVAKSLEGKVMRIDEAIKILENQYNKTGTFRIHRDKQFISLEEHTVTGGINGWRVIKFKPLKKENV